MAMDEPESALSPQRQLALLARMVVMVSEGETQFLIATHSPILLTYPGADIVSFDSAPLASIRLEDTSHYQITKGILEHPARYWRHLTGDGSAPAP
jgi:predicted ATPase